MVLVRLYWGVEIRVDSEYNVRGWASKSRMARRWYLVEITIQYIIDRDTLEVQLADPP